MSFSSGELQYKCKWSKFLIHSFVAVPTMLQKGQAMIILSADCDVFFQPFGIVAGTFAVMSSGRFSHQ
jgi:hypothetical protein